MTSGLDNIINLWDVRKFNNTVATKSNNNKYKRPQPIALYNCTKSVSSSYFSPSGQYTVATTMANKLDIFENIHLLTENNNNNNNPITLSPTKRVIHDNITGRWLTTFMATYHPILDIFCVGSMSRPRAIDIFHANGTLLRSITDELITSVNSRCCFHPCIDNIIIAGGNSSGRVTILQ